MSTRGRVSGARLAVLAIAAGLYAFMGGSGLASSEKAGTQANAVKQEPAPNLCNDCDPPPTPRPTPTPTPPPPRPSFTTLMSRYTPYDINADGIREINSLRALFPNPEPYYSTPHGVVLVLVSPELVTDDPNIQMSRLEMSLWLGLLGSDISADGFFPYFIEASVHSGLPHQDGRTLLALRRFVKEFRGHYPVAGVLLVGPFPDAAIVRSVFAKSNRENPINLDSGLFPITHTGHLLQIGSEFITPRAEIVLGDMDGNWEALYQQMPFTVTHYDALPLQDTETYPQDGQVIVTPHYKQTTSSSYQDVFYIQDHSVTATPSGGWLNLSITNLTEPSPEVSAADRLRPNRIARPEIHVSRLDPRRVAIMPTAPRDIDGKFPLDASGRPQKLRYVYQANLTWRRDRTLERRLIADYIDRGHRFRLGHDNSLPFRTSAIRSDDDRLQAPASFNSLLRQAHGSFGSSTAVDNATLLDYINWLRDPAVLRGIAAHSEPINSIFGPETSPLELEFATGGLDFATGSHVWRWVGRWENGLWVLEPSFAGITVGANFHIYRTMWEFDTLRSAGQNFVVHDGCEVMRPKNAETVPYDDSTYGQADNTGRVANGESLMFYANGLGLMARNKVFDDNPAGFYEAVKNTGRFGFGWRAYFLKEADNAGLNERTADPTQVFGTGDRRWRTLQRKRSYFWNTIGDFTLKIRY
jgi:hypothetical protein